jgi:hypothetical protein
MVGLGYDAHWRQIRIWKRNIRIKNHKIIGNVRILEKLRNRIR